MGPRARYLGQQVPKETLIWQDPIPAVDHPLIDDAGHRRAEGEDPRLGPDRAAAGLDRLGVGLDLPRHRQARRRQRRAHPPGAAEGLGGQQSARTGQGARDARGDPEGVQRHRRQEGLARRPDRARRQRRGREGGEGRRLRRDGAVHAGPHRRDAGADRRRSPSRRSNPRADGFRNYYQRHSSSCRRRRPWSTGRNC